MMVDIFITLVGISYYGFLVSAFCGMTYYYLLGRQSLENLLFGLIMCVFIIALGVLPLAVAEEVEKEKIEKVSGVCNGENI